MLWQWRNGVWILNKVYVIGMGPGAYEQMTVAAVEALKGCDVIVGYTVYVDLMKKYFPEKEFMTTPMRKEPERCRLAFEEAKKGRVTAMVCSGDAGNRRRISGSRDRGSSGCDSSNGGSSSAWCTAWTRLLSDQFK